MCTIWKKMIMKCCVLSNVSGGHFFWSSLSLTRAETSSSVQQCLVMWLASVLKAALRSLSQTVTN